MLFKPRRHQAELDETIKAIIAGDLEASTIVCNVCPGGGKSLLSLIAAARLIEAGLIDKVCIIVPRLALKTQVAVNFLDDNFREFLGHTPARPVTKGNPRSFEINEATNEPDPAKGTGIVGFVTTYHALIKDVSKIHEYEFKQHRYLIVLDEFHHSAFDTSTHDSLVGILSLAKYRLLLTGTLERNDRKRISFLPYTRDPAGRESDYIVDTNNPACHWIRYDVEEAKRDGALRDIEYVFIDGATSYLNTEGRKVDREKLGADPSALFTALSTEFAQDLVGRCLEHWRDFRKKEPRSKLLIVCAGQEQARNISKYLDSLGQKNHYAISDESQAARKHIAQFKGDKRPELHVLVTVGMAYEGLDVPSITHIACVTHIRSAPWIYQMLGRAWRFDRSSKRHHKAQYGVAYLPNDDRMHATIEKLKLIMDKAHDPKLLEGSSAPPPREFISPISSSATTESAGNWDGETISEEEKRKLMRIADKHNVGLSLFTLKAIVEDYNRPHLAGFPAKELRAPPASPVARNLTYKEERDLLKKDVSRLIRQSCHGDPETIKERNYTIKKTYGSRSKMSVDDLRELKNALLGVKE
jgi:superfamily II DNA or RNA helicase